MPTYEYEYLNDSGEPTGERFEIFQKMSDKPLVKHPNNGKLCRRAVTAPAVAGKWSDMKAKSTLSNENLERMGFTKYEKRGDGYMERVAGKEGPRSISADS
ncbi:MAG: FmdB family transcriptional regulator [Planctomycetota bacterium]